MTKPAAILSWSGGKDAAWALHALRQRGEVEVVGLLTTITEGYERIAMQGIRVDVLHAQAAAAGLPVIEARIPQRADNASYEAGFADALARVRQRWPGLRHVAFGDLFLADIRSYREQALADTGIEPVFPLWGRPTGDLAREMVDQGVRATITCVDPRQLPSSFAGRAFDHELLADLPERVDPCGENGEFHTFVADGPGFAAPLEVRVGEVVERDGFVFADVLPVLR